MEIIVNGERSACPDGSSVASLVVARGHKPERVVVEVEGAVLPRSSWARALAPGERVELVGFVGGG